MTRTSKLLGAVSSLVLVALSASPAFAEVVGVGTSAGTPITNSVTVTFEVNNIEQTTTGDSDTFVVDRKVNFTLEEVGGAATLVTPGSIERVTTFELTNLSNDTLDFALSLVQQDGGASAFGDTDNFDTGSVTYYIDDDGTAGFSALDSEVTYIDGLASDTPVTIFVVTSIPLTQANGDVATVVLSATAHDGSTDEVLGALLETSADNVVDEVDTVLADGIGETDGQYDGVMSAKDDYKVQAALLSVAKTSYIVSDPISGVGETPKAIPGAVVRYCIAVSNGAGAQTATSITVRDNLPVGVTFVEGSIEINGTTTGATCNEDGVAGGVFDAGEVSGSLSDIEADNTLTLVFDATID